MSHDQLLNDRSQAEYFNNDDTEYNAADSLLPRSRTNHGGLYPPSKHASTPYGKILGGRGKVRTSVVALSLGVVLFLVSLRHRAWENPQLPTICGTINSPHLCTDILTPVGISSQDFSAKPNAPLVGLATEETESGTEMELEPETLPAIIPVTSHDAAPEIGKTEELPPIVPMDRYIQPPRTLRPSWPDPWEDLGADWEGKAFLAVDRFVEEKNGRWKGMKDPVVPSDPPASVLAQAYEYAASQSLLATQDSLDPSTGRPSPIKHEQLYWGKKDEWKAPTLKLSNFGQASGPKMKLNRKVQYTGRIDPNSEETIAESQRREWVKRAFIHAWEGYKSQAWGHDELKPVSGAFRNPFNGWGATLIDSLDTLLLMNLSHEYNLAREHVAKVDFTYLSNGNLYSTILPSEQPPMTPIQAKVASYNAKSPIGVPTFETVIRYLGGLLSAFDLSQDGLMLQRATELGDWLLPCLGTRYGLSQSQCQIGSNARGFASGRVNLAEVGSLTLEFTRLSMLTGNEVYYHAVQRSMDTLDTVFHSAVKTENRTIPRGRLGTLLPHYIDPAHPAALSGDYSFGGSSDSYYEYLIKQDQLLSGAVPQYRRMYIDAIESAYQYLISKVEVIPGRDDLTTIGSMRSGVWNPEIEHLTCFAGGMLALGSRLLGRTADLETAKNLTNTCVWAYESTYTGIGPEVVRFYPKNDPSRFIVVDNPNGPGKIRVPRQSPLVGVRSTDAKYISRPETIESVFYMYRLTGDRAWQDRGWRMFTSWIEWAITEYGFADINNVYSGKPYKRDFMQSFALAETLKYYYLLFSPMDVISLDDWVFNTEAHPFRIPKTNSPASTSLWTGPEMSQSPVNNFQSSIGEGTFLQKWNRVQQALVLRQAETADVENKISPKVESPLFVRPSDAELKQAEKNKNAIEQYQKEMADKAKVAAAVLKVDSPDVGVPVPAQAM